MSGPRLSGAAFADHALEAEFRRHAWPEWSRTTRRVSLLAASLALALGYVDYAALGPGPALYASWTIRLVTLACALLVAHVSHGARAPRRLDCTVFAFMLWFGTAIALLVFFGRKGLMRETPGTILTVLGFYLFVPTRFAIQWLSALWLTGTFLLVEALYSPHTATEFVTVAIELAICNILGAFTARRTHLLQRREYLKLQQLRERARFEELVARLSTRFISLPLEQLDGAVRAALAEIGEFAGADRCYVFEFDWELRRKSCTYEWCAPGIEPQAQRLQGLPVDGMRWEARQLLAGETVCVASVAQLPPEAQAEREEFERESIRSLVLVPMQVGGELWGFIGFDSVRAERAWTAELVALLRLAGEMIANVLQRRRADDIVQRQARALESSIAELERSNRELQQFAYVASHDLQEPLRTISSFASLLAKRNAQTFDAASHEYVDYVNQGVARMQRMIEGLLQYARVDSRGKAFAPCNTRAVVDSALANLRAAIEEAQAQVTVGALPAVEGDAGQLAQLFQNLVANAIKFRNGAAPRVEVACQRSGPFWEFRVADNGIGIEPQYAGRLFKVFTRLHTPDQYPGSGIGLAIAKRIVERHRGRIWVEPNGKEGSVFCFTLPVSQQARDFHGDSGYAAAAAPPGGAHPVPPGSAHATPQQLQRH